ncbi:MAG: SusD/RagB family nutrient-binding outer membrane lipoprotein [Cyclobacteriaceae bacterium]|nr:SusD/RagB family nutrient-binding outer membrane lipoprotein [Cyclobacteriaceae bacterium]
MKTSIYRLILGILLFSPLSCTEHFQEVNTNPNGVTDSDPAFIFASGARASFRSGIAGAYDYRIAAQMAHYYVGVNNDHFNDQYLQDLSGESYEALYDSEYASKLRYFNDVLRLTAPGGEYEDKLQYAVADAMAVMSYSILTDAFGSIPDFEGGFGNDNLLLPSYDDQETIYQDLLQRLTDDITALKTATTTVNLLDQDPVFKDDPVKWSKFVNSLRLRLAMRIRHVDQITASNYITQSLEEPLMESNADNAVSFNVDGDNSSLFSPWFGTFDFWNFRMSDKVITQLTSTNDPRLAIYANPITGGIYKGMVNGLIDSKFASEVNKPYSSPGQWLVGKAAPTILMSAGEIAFLQAECALFNLGGTDANAHYQRGIDLSLKKVGVAQEDIDTFLATEIGTLTGTQEEQFEQIGKQMWLTLAPNFTEAYNYMRRTGYPVIPLRDGINTSLGDTEGELPSRVLYPLSEKLTNETNVQEAINSIGGQDILKTRVWWDVRR